MKKIFLIAVAVMINTQIMASDTGWHDWEKPRQILEEKLGSAVRMDKLEEFVAVNNVSRRNDNDVFEYRAGRLFFLPKSLRGSVLKELEIARLIKPINKLIADYYSNHHQKTFVWLDLGADWEPTQPCWKDGICYICTGNSIVTIDVERKKRLSSINLGFDCCFLHTSENYLYAEGQEERCIIDLKTQQIKRLSPPQMFRTSRAQAHLSYGFLNKNFNSLYVYNFEEDTYQDRVPLVGDYINLVFMNSFIYVLTENEGLAYVSIFDAKKPQTVKQQFLTPTASTLYAVQSVGGNIYLPLNGWGKKGVNIRRHDTISNIIFLASEKYTSLFSSDPYLCVQEDDSFSIIDAKTQRFIYKQLPLGFPLIGFAFFDDFFYVTYENKEDYEIYTLEIPLKVKARIVSQLQQFPLLSSAISCDKSAFR